MHKEMVLAMNEYPPNQRGHLMKATTSVTSRGPSLSHVPQLWAELPQASQTNVPE